MCNELHTPPASRCSGSSGFFPLFRIPASSGFRDGDCAIAWPSVSLANMGQAELLLGIDIGTTNVAAVIADPTGQVLADASFAHQADLAALAGRSEQDP